MRLLEGVEVFFDEVTDVGTAEDFDVEADFFGGVEIDDEMALDRLMLNDVGDLDCGRSGLGSQRRNRAPGIPAAELWEACIGFLIIGSFTLRFLRGLDT